MKRVASHQRKPRSLAMILLALLWCAAGSSAAEVSVELSSREVYAGIPFSLTIVIRNYEAFDEADLPSIPQLPGLTVLGPPSQSTQSSYSSINGRVTQSKSLTLRYSLVATQPGQYTLPPIEVTVDGRTFAGNPITITASKPEAGDLLYVDVQAEKDAVYLGEPVNLTLRIWIKRYEDDQFDVELRAGDTWSLVETNRSTWGEFVEAIRETSGPLRRGPDARTVRRPDDAGIESVYYVYEIGATLWPQQAGPLAIEPVAVYITYPTRLERSRDFFSRDQLRIADARPVIAAAELPQVMVKSPPEAGRPPFYAGAVGRFDIAVTAQPTEVAVGDPITITLTVTDRTPGGTRLDLLQPPPLQRIAELEESFRIPGDPLAGVVEGRTKTFTQTIRARSDQVNQVPAIPFAYFDPDGEQYHTVQSEPIELNVQSASMVTMSDIVGGAGGAEPRATELTEVAGGILANQVGADVLLTQQVFAVGWPQIVIVVAPPFLFIVIAFGRYQTLRLRNDHGYARRRSARRRAMRRLSEAHRPEGRHQAEAVAAALSDYVADRYNLPAGALTSLEIAERLRTSGVSPALIEEVESLLAECEALRYAGGTTTTKTGSIADLASRCIKRLERERIR